MSIKKLLVSAAILTAGFGASAPAQAGTNPFLGEIVPSGYTFCPRGSVNTDGQLLAIASNNALFSLFGTIYGGDGRTTFGIPRLRGRTPIHTGQGPGLSNRPLGQLGGTQTNTFLVSQIPGHNHQAGVQTTDTNANSPNPASDALGIADVNTYVDGGAAPSQNFMNGSTVILGNTGNNVQQNNMQAFETLRYCVYTVGVYPSRN